VEIYIRALRWAGPVLAAAAIAGLWGMSTGTDALDRVPDLEGLGLQAAQAKAQSSGYPTRVMLTEGPGVAGTVLDHEPAAGSLAQRGSPIVLRVTQGARQIRVPDVRGMPVAEALRLLSEAELAPGNVTYRQDPGKEPNRVVTSDPAPGAAVDAGTEVNLTATTP
jgi:serine/threonine-protein kinase